VEESLKNGMNIRTSQVKFNEYMYKWLEIYKKILFLRIHIRLMKKHKTLYLTRIQKQKIKRFNSNKISKVYKRVIKKIKQENYISY